MHTDKTAYKSGGASKYRGNPSVGSRLRGVVKPSYGKPTFKVTDCVWSPADLNADDGIDRTFNPDAPSRKARAQAKELRAMWRMSGVMWKAPASMTPRLVKVTG